MGKRIAFDFDGTLIDTMPALRRLAVKLTTELCDLPQNPDVGRSVPTEEVIVERYNATAGETFREQLCTILPRSEKWTPDHQAAISAVYEHEKRTVLTQATIFNDAAQAVLRLRQAGHSLWVVTSTTTHLVVERLDRAGLWHHFDGCLGPEMGDKSTKLDRIEADIFIGDTNRDWQHAVYTEIAPARPLCVRRDPALLSEENTFADSLGPIVEEILK